jgi:predicted outer membrane repeat protein
MTIDADNKSQIFAVPNTGTSEVITISGLTLINGYSATDGGAIHANMSKLILNDVHIKYSNARNGAAIYNSGNALVLNAVTITCNTAVTSGGAVFHANGNLTITDSTFTDNTAVRSHGGAIYLSGGVNAVYDISNTTFTDNKATQLGGAIVQYNGQLILTDCDFNSNTGQYGGGVSQNSKEAPTMTVTGGSFIGNSATLMGGAMTVSNGVITDVLFKDNDAAEYGGAISVASAAATAEIVDSTLEGNSAGYGGGAIAQNGGKTVRVSGSTFSDNSSDNGGAFFQNAGTSNIADSTFDNNIADARGGAIAISTGNSVIGGNTSILGNSAGDSGGAVYLRNGTFDISDVRFESNEAAFNGGAIFQNGGTLKLGDATFLKNSAQAGVGGGLFVAATSVKTHLQNGLKFMENHATDAGGAVAFARNNEATQRLIGSISADTIMEGNTTAIRGGNSLFFGKHNAITVNDLLGNLIDTLESPVSSEASFNMNLLTESDWEDLFV